MTFDVIIIGGGAAGFFAANELLSVNRSARVVIVEKSGKLLSKVRISGGGRCNVTHRCDNPFELAGHYPRGQRALKSLFKTFNARDMINWLAERGVDVHAESDGRIFPASNDSATIVECFVSHAVRMGVKLELNCAAAEISRHEGLLLVRCTDSRSFLAKAVVVAIGGNASPGFYEWLRRLGHEIKVPVPSLFTFNDRARTFSDLMGVAVADGEVRITGTRFVQRGAILITHWGLSGPAVIKLSAWAAEDLHRAGYDFNVSVNWTGAGTETSVREVFARVRETSPRQKVRANPMFAIPSRLWVRLCERAGIDESRIWAEAPSRAVNKLLEELIRCSFHIEGKTTFKEEFVTCGGIPLNEIDPATMESRKYPGVFFAGEVLDIDGETGGFNFQAAWTTGYIAAHAIAERISTGPAGAL